MLITAAGLADSSASDLESCSCHTRRERSMRQSESECLWSVDNRRPEVSHRRRPFHIRASSLIALIGWLINHFCTLTGDARATVL